MFSSRHTKCCAVFLVIFIVLINTVSLEAKRWGGGGSRSHGKSSSSSSSSRGSKAPVHIPTSFQVPRPHPPPSAPHPPPRSTGPPLSNPKDSSSIFINSQGGGRTRPDSSPKDLKPHQPSAPSETVTKVTAGNVQNSPHGSNAGSAYPPWANPGAAPHGGGNFPSSGSSMPHGSVFPNGPVNTPNKVPAGPLTSSGPYPPPTHPPGPIYQPSIHPSGGGGTYHPYPNAPHGTQGPYPLGSPYPSGLPQGMPMPNAPHIGFGKGYSSGQPLGSPHSTFPSGSSSSPPHTTVINHNYGGYPAGNPHSPYGRQDGGQYSYGGPPAGQQPFVPGQTMVVMQTPQSSGRGVGEIFKEAVIYSGTNILLNRAINGAPHHHDHQPVAAPAAAGAAPAASTPTVTNTVIYNNHYGTPESGAAPVAGGASSPAPPASGQAIVPGAQPPFPATPSMGGINFPAGTAGNPSTGTSGTSPAGSPSSPLPAGTSANSQPHLAPGNAAQSTGAQSTPATANNTNATAMPVYQYYISNEELWTLTESLFAKNEYNVSHYLELNTQNLMLGPNVTDVAPAPLLYVKWEGYAIPTIKVLRDMYKHYEFDANKKETVNDESRRSENIMLDTFLETDIMTMTMTWLSQKGYVEPDSFEWKDTLRHIWMTKIYGATSGFERIFLAEKYDVPSILGGQNWVYFDYQEANKLINYMGYVKNIDLGGKAHLLKVNYKIDDFVKSNTTMLVGTPPELDMALYTICYYARPNDICNVSLGGVKFDIYTHAFRYFGKDLIDVGIMSV